MTMNTAPSRARILFYEPHTADGRRTAELLERDRLDVVDCEEGKAVLEALVETHADALVFELSGEDDGLLRLIRRAAPDLPLVLIAPDDSLAARRDAQSFQPIYYVVLPVDAAELREAVSAALLKSGDPKIAFRRRALGH